MNIDEYVKIISKGLTKSLVVFDTETTGLDTNKDEIIQFAGMRINPDGTTEELTFLCKPSVPVDPRAAEVHGRTTDSLQKCPKFKSFIPKIKRLFKDSDVAGFNLASFDIKILGRQMQENGISEFFKDAVVYDAYKIFCQHLTRKLGDAIKYYVGEDIKDAHDALGDVKTTVAVIARQVEREQTSVAEVANKSTTKSQEKSADDYIVYDLNKEPILNFSKHKGMAVKLVDKGFIKWVLNKDFPKHVKDILRQYV